MADSATAQDISLNYERLSSMEEPLATEIGDLTLTLTGLVDAPLTADQEVRGSSPLGYANFFKYLG